MENIIGVLVWIVLILIYIINKSSKRQKKPNLIPKKPADENVSTLIQELIKTQNQHKSNKDIYRDEEEAHSLEVTKSATQPKKQHLPETYKSRVAQDNLQKEEQITSKRNNAKEVLNEYQEFIQDPDNLRKAFILKEIFDRKY